MSDFQTVKVASVEVKTGGGEEGKKSWTKFTLVDGNGSRAGTFDTKVGKFLQDHVGQQIDVTTEENGKFTNLLTAVEHVEAPKSNGYAARDPETEMRIAREACLKVAADVAVSADPRRSKPNVEEVLRVADAFVRWVYSGEISGPSRLAASEPTAITAPRTQRGVLLAKAIAAFNRDAAEALSFAAQNNLGAVVSEWTDDQLVALVNHMDSLIPA